MKKYEKYGEKHFFQQPLQEERKPECYAVTIIVDGGCFTCETILHDLKAGRPVVIVDGSGRLANLLAMLLRNNRTVAYTE